jgi:Cytochrome oxidase complex assembly protein 1
MVLTARRRRIVLGIVVLVAVMIAITHWFVVGGAPFRTAEAFIVAHPSVHAELGTAQQVRLSWGWSISITGAKGQAHLRCRVVGSRANGMVDLDLVRAAGVWTVMDANLVLPDRRAVRLSP